MERSFNPLDSGTNNILLWTKRILREYSIRPKRSLSQNFVINPFLIREVVSHTESNGDVLEIGCGIGTLSLALLLKVRRLLCVEIDPRLCGVVKDVVNNQCFTVVNSDARYIPLTLETIVSTLPYHITSDILVKIARENSVKKAILVLQREVAERLLAPPGTKIYGKLTVLVRNLFDIVEGGIYLPHSFYPCPEVYHQVVVFNRKRTYSYEIEVLEKITRLLFSERRKIIDRLIIEKLGVKLSELGNIGNKLSGRRVFTITPELWLELSRVLVDRGFVL